MPHPDCPADLAPWIGRSETSQCIAAREPLARLADLLDYQEPPWPNGEAPPLGHWLYFAPRARMSETDTDGHPKRGGFLPPIRLPRRMWAGSAIDFHASIAVGADLVRRTTIRDIRQKRGSTGELLFVTLEHEIAADGQLALTERQDLVYREAASALATRGPQTSPAAGRKGEVERTVEPGPVALFRYSALTFNSHRIHYDRDFARNVEGYAGLVVHGPFAATLLMDMVWRTFPGAAVRRFAFRGVMPLLDTAPFTLCLSKTEETVSLWCRDASGQETMKAEAELRC